MNTPVRRFIALIEQMGEEVDHAWGWKSAVARRLGVHQTLVSALSSGERTSVGGRSIEAAIANVPLDPEFFYGEFAETPHYRAFVTGSNLERPEAYPALEVFLQTVEGKSCSEDERSHLRAIRFDKTPTVLTYHYRLLALRSQIDSAQNDAMDEVMEAAEKRALERGGRHFEPAKLEKKR